MNAQKNELSFPGELKALGAATSSSVLCAKSPLTEVMIGLLSIDYLTSSLSL